jgi:class 3 adenylate cyclase
MVVSGSEGISLPTLACPTGLALQTVALMHWLGIAGLAVTIASRVCDLAGPGEVLVTRTVTDHVVGSGIEFVDRGEQELKGVPGTWRLFGEEPRHKHCPLTPGR